MLAEPNHHFTEMLHKERQSNEQSALGISHTIKKKVFNPESEENHISQKI